MPKIIPKLTDADLQLVEQLSGKLSKAQIADKLGFCRNTFITMCEKNAELKKSYNKGRTDKLVQAADDLYKISKGEIKSDANSIKAIIFILKTQGEGHWSENKDEDKVAQANQVIQNLVIKVPQSTKEPLKTQTEIEDELEAANERYLASL